MDMLKTKMLRNPERISYESLKERITAITSLYDRALACLAYASGARASELNKIEKQDLVKETIDGVEYLSFSVKVLKKKKLKDFKEDGKYFDEHPGTRNPDKRIYEKYAAKFNPDFHKRYNLTPPAPFIRRALVRIDETWLVSSILEFAEHKEKQTDVLFPVHRATLYKKLTSALEINPHGFRKLRATHLVQKYNYSGHQLAKFFGWSSSQPSDYYVRLNVNDLAYGGK